MALPRLRQPPLREAGGGRASSGHAWGAAARGYRCGGRGRTGGSRRGRGAPAGGPGSGEGRRAAAAAPGGRQGAPSALGGPRGAQVGAAQCPGGGAAGRSAGRAAAAAGTGGTAAGIGGRLPPRARGSAELRGGRRGGEGSPGEPPKFARPAGGGSCPAQGWGPAASLNVRGGGRRGPHRPREPALSLPEPPGPRPQHVEQTFEGRAPGCSRPPSTAAPGPRRTEQLTSCWFEGFGVLGFNCCFWGCFFLFFFFPFSPTSLLLLLGLGLLKHAGANAALEKPRAMLQRPLWQRISDFFLSPFARAKRKGGKDLTVLGTSLNTRLRAAGEAGEGAPRPPAASPRFS